MEIKKKKNLGNLCGFKLGEITKGKKKIPGLNDAVEPPRCHWDKGDKAARRSSAMALNGVDSLSLLDLFLFFLLFAGFGSFG